MTRKALARRIVELLFNGPATRRGTGGAPTRRAARILAGCFVARRSKITAGILAATLDYTPGCGDGRITVETNHVAD